MKPSFVRDETALLFCICRNIAVENLLFSRRSAVWLRQSVFSICSKIWHRCMYIHPILPCNSNNICDSKTEWKSRNWQCTFLLNFEYRARLKLLFCKTWETRFIVFFFPWSSRRKPLCKFNRDCIKYMLASCVICILREFLVRVDSASWIISRRAPHHLRQFPS
jgi:hypothetical protein